MNRTFKDQLGDSIIINFPPKRIISLVPSITELLVELGAPVIGRTKFCVHPQETTDSIDIIGGTKKFRFDLIANLDPDLIIGNKEENYKEGIEELRKAYPVWMSDVATVSGSLEMIRNIGDLVGEPAKAEQIRASIVKRLTLIKNQFRNMKALYLIWQKPWMSVGSDTYIHSMLKWMGFENVIDQDRYPELSDLEIQELNPDTVMLSSEPFPFGKKHLEDIQKLLPKATIELVDGEFFSWYGSRLLHVDTWKIPVNRRN